MPCGGPGAGAFCRLRACPAAPPPAGRGLPCRRGRQGRDPDGDPSERAPEGAALPDDRGDELRERPRHSRRDGPCRRSPRARRKRRPRRCRSGTDAGLRHGGGPGHRADLRRRLGASAGAGGRPDAGGEGRGQPPPPRQRLRDHRGEHGAAAPVAAQGRRLPARRRPRAGDRLHPVGRGGRRSAGDRLGADRRADRPSARGGRTPARARSLVAAAGSGADPARPRGNRPAAAPSAECAHRFEPQEP